jgi:tripartite-type tricarboxylate transporter receptor subunit TctC
MRWFGIWMVSVITLVAGTGAACGQGFPVKPIRIVTAAVGGSNDVMARLIGQGISGPLGQPVVVENRAGSVVIPAEVVARSAPDGHTLLIYGGVVWLLPLMRDNVPYDPVRDFAPITLTNRQPNVLVVHPSLPVKSVRELIALARTKPGVLSFSTGGTGTTSHLAPELFKAMTGVNMVRIPYASGATEVTDLLSGQVQLTFSTGAVARHIASGKLRALAVTTADTSALYPDLPTIAASGVPGYDMATIYGMWAAARTPEAIIARLNEEIVRVLRRPDVKEKFFGNGVEVVGSTPAEFAATINAQVARMGKVIRDAGIRAD